MIIIVFIFCLFILLLSGYTSDDFACFFTIIGIIICVTIIVKTTNERKKKEKINKQKALICQDKKKEAIDHFDRSVSIGDHDCMIYFDVQRKEIMILRVSDIRIERKIIKNFEFPGRSCTKYTNPYFTFYCPTTRELITGQYIEQWITHEITNLATIDQNVNAKINNGINAKVWDFKLQTATNHILIDEQYGLIVIVKNGKVNQSFNYVTPEEIEKRIGNESAVCANKTGRYMIITDDFFEKLIILTPDSYNLYNYSDIIEVTYEENESVIYRKSNKRAIKGALVGSLLMGRSGSVVGGLTGDNKKISEIKSMNVKVLLRDKEKISFTLSFLEQEKVTQDSQLYKNYIDNANRAKDIISIIIDKVKQTDNDNNESENKQDIVAIQSVADEIRKLAQLKSDGILTEEEFKKQKDKLLS